jgi:hypothetical protein
MLLIAYVLALAAGVEPSWLPILGVLAVADGAVLAFEMVPRGLGAITSLIPRAVPSPPSPPHCVTCCPERPGDD